MTTDRSLIATVSCIALTVALAACGGQSFPKTQAPPPRGTTTTTGKASAAKGPQARLLAAVGRATDSKTARVTLNESLSGFGGANPDSNAPAAYTIAGGGLIDLAQERLSLQLALRGGGQDVPVEIRLVDHTLYLGSKADWFSEPFSGANAQTPVPSTYLDFLRGVSADVRTEGHEVLRGDETTRYGATLDLVRAAGRAANPAQRSGLEHAIATFGAVKIPVTVWIDGLGRLRKIQMSMDLSGVAGKLGAMAGTHPKIDLTLELYDFGVAVDVQVPAHATPQLARAQDRAAQSDLRNALTAEKTIYTDQMIYSADPAAMKQIEPSLGWAGKLSVVVGAAGSVSGQVVCLSERSASGSTFSLADVAVGPHAGTYFGKTSCPALVNEQNLSTLALSW